MNEQSIIDTAPSDASEPIIEQLWFNLPEEIREICLMFGGIPFSREALFAVADDADRFIEILTNLELLEVVSQLQLYQDASQKITDVRNAMAMLPKGPEPPYTKEELRAREALYKLKAYHDNPDLYPEITKPLFFRFSEEFSRLVQSLDDNG